jgi:hypothetical protein
MKFIIKRYEKRYDIHKSSSQKFGQIIEVNDYIQVIIFFSL